jgi:hypothetical protein
MVMVVVAFQIANFIDHLADAVVADIIQPLETAVQILAVLLHHGVVETIGTVEWAP